MNEQRELPDRLNIDFLITDESINRYGWRLLVGGIDLSGFLKNPVCCVQHDTYSIPVGRWTNMRTEDGKLLGTLEFDRNDPEAVKLYWKYQDGYMNAVSLNVVPVEESDALQYLLQGQQFPTLVRSELLEVSLVTLPGQKNAIKLSTPEGGDYKLNLITKKNKIKNMEKTDVTVEELQKELAQQRALNADNLIERHKLRGVVTDGETESLRTLALANYEATKTLLEARTPVDLDKIKQEVQAKNETAQVVSFVQNLSDGKTVAATDERASWNYLDYYKKDMKALHEMEVKEPEKYKALAAAYEKEMAPNGYIS